MSRMIMKKTWGKLFRRKSITETELQEDYPTDTESHTSYDDEQMRQEWQHHLARKLSNSSDNDSKLNKEWEYYSEYNVSFSSDNSIIDAYRERDKWSPVDGEFEDVFNRAAKEHRGKKESGKMQYLSPNNVTDPKPRSSTPLSQRKATIPSIKEKVKALENAHSSTSGKRRTSCVPTASPKVQQDGADRSATWNKGVMKKKLKKQVRKRRRARDLSDISDDESNYTVNLSLDQLNDIIKKNVSSAVKTMVIATSKGKKVGQILSPSGSFEMSTETETIFSGSSSHSNEVGPGMLNKQIKAQLDMDKLRGIRRGSLVPGIVPDMDHGCRRTSGGMGYHPNQIQGVPTIHEFNPSHFGTTPHQIDVNPSPYLNVMANVAPVPPPAPPPPPPHQRVTYAPMSTPGYSGHDNLHQTQTVRHTHEPSSPMTDLINQELNNQLEVLGAGALNRLQARRHTLATLGNEPLLTGLSDNFESKLEQVNNAIRLLDTNMNLGDSATSTKTTSSKQLDTPIPKPSENQPSDMSNTAQITNQNLGAELTPLPQNVLAPVMNIAEHIKALTKKPEKKWEPGKLMMSGCVRAFLILLNILFMITGSGLVGLGVWMLTDKNIETYFAILNVDNNSSDFKVICYALIGVGAFVTSVAFTGCCGGIKSSKCMLTMYIVMVAVIAVAEAGLGAIVMVNMDSPSAIPIMSSLFSEVESNMLMLMRRSIVEKYAPSTMMGTTWDKVQIELECCGASGPDDYKLSAWKNDTTNELTIPDTCCVLLSKTAEVPEPSNKLLCQMGTTGFLHSEGCYDVMVGWFKDNSTFILAGGIASVCIEVIMFIFAIIICRKSHAEEVKYKNRHGIQ